MSVNTICDKKRGIGLRNLKKNCNLPDKVLRIEKKVWNKPYLTYSSLNNQSEFVITLFVFYTVLTCQTHEMYYLFLQRNNIEIVYFRFLY